MSEAIDRMLAEARARHCPPMKPWGSEKDRAHREAARRYAGSRPRSWDDIYSEAVAREWDAALHKVAKDRGLSGPAAKALEKRARDAAIKYLEGAGAREIHDFRAFIDFHAF